MIKAITKMNKKYPEVENVKRKIKNRKKSEITLYL